MSRYGSGFREPPWVYGSSETMKWVDASNPNKKDKSKDKKRSHEKFLTDLKIKFDFNVDHKIVKSSCMLCRMIGLNKIEEDFDIFAAAELILRGLAKSKFKNLSKIIVDGEKIYDHPEVKKDLRKTIDNIDDFKDSISSSKIVEIDAILDEVETCVAKIKIKKIHKEKEHSINIFIKGSIKESQYHTFVNYINGKMDLKEEK